MSANRRRAARPRNRAEAERSAEDSAERSSDQAHHPADGSALDGVRLHRDAAAARLTEALGARAVTAGTDIFFSAAAPALETPSGRRLLAHELTHVVQQRVSGPAVQLFRADERALIAPTLAAMMAVIETIVTTSTRADGGVRMDELVQRAGGSTAGRGLPEPVRSDPAPPGMYGLTSRYLFTRRAGLIDLRHFLQLMYITWFTAVSSPSMAARGAARRGIEHEERAEPESRFGGEDLTSNALGAWTGTRLAGFPQRDDLIDRIRETLTICAPVDFTGLSTASQDAVVAFYATLTPAGEPLNQNRTAVALIPSVPELAGQDRSFPFGLDTDDPQRATVSGPTFEGGPSSLTSDSSVRQFVNDQRASVLAALPDAEVVRMCQRLLSGWVSDEDLQAFARLFGFASTVAKTTLRAVIRPADLTDLGQRTRLRDILGSSR